MDGNNGGGDGCSNWGGVGPAIVIIVVAGVLMMAAEELRDSIKRWWRGE